MCPNLGDPRYLFAVEVTLRQNMPEELFLNDDPDSLMIEETSTLGLPNISDITRFQIEFVKSSSGKLKSLLKQKVVIVFYFVDFWAGLFYWEVLKISAVILGLFTSFLLPIALYNIIEYNSCRHTM